LTVIGPAAQVTISGNHAVQVMVIITGATVALHGLTIADGFFISDEFLFCCAGGGIENAGTLTITNSTLSGNEAGFAGGIDNSGTLTITDSTFLGNGAEEAGGIRNRGTLTIANSTFSGNGAKVAGAIDNESTLTITNSTFSGNGTNFGAGAILNEGTLTITNSTLSGNTVFERVSGGGIENGGTATLNNTIIANSTGGDCVGTITATSSLDDDGSCVGGGTGNLTANPLLGPLANNGGPTQTLALLPGSPAIDAGSNALAVDSNGKPLLYDQRGLGYERIVNATGIAKATVDIGAYEVQTIDSLIRAVDLFETKPIVKFFMDLTLLGAKDELKEGDKILGDKLLTAFIDEVNAAQKDKSLTAADAEILINIATEFKE
jgi:hypothetical protein